MNAIDVGAHIIAMGALTGAFISLIGWCTIAWWSTFTLWIQELFDFGNNPTDER